MCCSVLISKAWFMMGRYIHHADLEKTIRRQNAGWLRVGPCMPARQGIHTFIDLAVLMELLPSGKQTWLLKIAIYSWFTRYISDSPYMLSYVESLVSHGLLFCLDLLCLQNIVQPELNSPPSSIRPFVIKRGWLEILSKWICIARKIIYKWSFCEPL